MISPARNDLLNLLTELSECAPSVRFGQLIANLSYLAKGPANESIWDAEDEELLEAARRHLLELKARKAPAA